MADKRIIIFDFDGTLADSAPIIRAIYADIATKNKLRVMTDEDYAMLRQGSLNAARKWSGVRLWQYPLLVRGVRKLMKLESEKVSLFPGVIQLIRDLRSHDLELYILSRNSSETVARVLKRYDLQDDFTILNRRKRSLGSKAAVITSLVQQKGVNKASVWMIGDEVRDILAAQKAGVNSVAVSWGLQHESILERYKPTYLVTDVQQLHQILQPNNA